MILAELQPYADDFEFEDFTFELDDHFSKYLDKEVFVKCKNLTATKTFTLAYVNQIWQELAPKNTDFSFLIKDTNKENVYEAKCSHHDCPTGQNFIITFNF